MLNASAFACLQTKKSAYFHRRSEGILICVSSYCITGHKGHPGNLDWLRQSVPCSKGIPLQILPFSIAAVDAVHDIIQQSYIQQLLLQFLHIFAANTVLQSAGRFGAVDVDSHALLHNPDECFAKLEDHFVAIRIVVSGVAV